MAEKRPGPPAKRPAVSADITLCVCDDEGLTQTYRIPRPDDAELRAAFDAFFEGIRTNGRIELMGDEDDDMDDENFLLTALNEGGRLGDEFEFADRQSRRLFDYIHSNRVEFSDKHYKGGFYISWVCFD